MPATGFLMARSVFTAEVVEFVLERANWHCEACGGRLNTQNREAYALHHRKSRRFHDHSAPNIMVVCGAIWNNCHNLSEWSIHANPARSHRLGHMLYEHEIPSDVPVIVARDLKELRA